MYQTSNGPKLLARLYGTAVIYSLLDLASDYHLEQLMLENSRQNHIPHIESCLLYQLIICFQCECSSWNIRS